MKYEKFLITFINKKVGLKSLIEMYCGMAKHKTVVHVQ